MEGKIIVIEGTDCSGKETQTNLLLDYLKNSGKKVIKYSFPNYDSPTGKIIGGPYLGKEHICKGWFQEGATNVNAKVASLYYAADRLYNIEKINKSLKEGYIVILDRYVYSNMAHQGAKLEKENDRNDMYFFIEDLEFNLLNLPKADIKLLLYMPYEVGKVLREGREEKLDEHESNKEYLLNAEKAYLEIANKYDFKIINCFKDNNVKSIEDIHKEIIDILG